MPVSHGNGPNQYRGSYQPALSSMTMPSTSISPSESAGGGSDSSEAAGSFFPSGASGCQASDVASLRDVSCAAPGCAHTVETATSSQSNVTGMQNFRKHME